MGGRRGALTAAVCALLLLGGCATTTTGELQTKLQTARQARVYFLRENSFGYAVALNIKVNGEKVGEIATGSSFFVDREPGEYTLTVDHPLAPGRFSTRIVLRPGGVYYVEVAPRTEGMMVGLIAGLPGQLLESAVSENSGQFSLVPLEEAPGRAKLTKLKG